MSVPNRGKRKFEDRLERRLLAYARVAGAAGVAALALAPPAKAKVVFSPTRTFLTPGGTLSLDLNHDGLNDFRLIDSQSLFFGINMLPQGSAANNEAVTLGTLALGSAGLKRSPLQITRVEPEWTS